MNKKIIAYIIIVLMVPSASGYYLYEHAVEYRLAKPALILKVSTNLTAEGTPMVNNVTFEQSSVPFFYKTVDTSPNFPEIDVNARINQLNSLPASYWAAAHYTGEGKYTLEVFFRSGSEPKRDDILIMPIRITNHNGAIAYKTTAFYQWE